MLFDLQVRNGGQGREGVSEAEIFTSTRFGTDALQLDGLWATRPVLSEHDPKSRTRCSRAWCPCSLGSPCEDKPRSIRWGTCVRSRPKPYPRLKPRFLKQMDGLDIDQFIHAVFPRWRPGTDPQVVGARSGELRGLVGELFRQIDVNGDGRVDWEEFTNFTIAVGTGSSTSQGGTTADEFEIRRVGRRARPHRPEAQVRPPHALRARSEE